MKGQKGVATWNAAAIQKRNERLRIVSVLLLTVFFVLDFYMDTWLSGRNVLFFSWRCSYILLVAVWTSTVAWEVIHTGVRRYLLSVAALLGFWLFERGVKWYLVRNADLERLLWYLYYVPMLLVPLLCIYVAVMLGKTEDSRLPLRYKLLAGVSIPLVALVLTNDFHRLVFSFPDTSPVWSDRDAIYEPGYFLAAGWAVFCGLFAFGTMVRKARALKDKRFFVFPLLSLGFLFVYGVLYALNIWKGVYLLHDMVAVFCFCIIATLEGCIRCGLIQSNTHYEELFAISSSNGQIVDEQFHVLLTAGQNPPMPEETIRRAVKESFVTPEHIRIACAPLRSGYVVWQEDISEISELIEELEDKGEYLSTYKATLQKEVDTGRRERQLVEQNRLYNVLMDETESEIDRLEKLIDRIDKAPGEAEEKRLIRRLALICTYIKRRSNLIFLAEENRRIEASELRYAIEEYLSSLRMCGVACAGLYDMKEPLALSQMLALYDAFQRTLMYVLDSLQSLFVSCREKDGGISIRITLTWEGDILGLALPGVTVCERDGDEWVLEMTFPEGGDGKACSF